MEILKDNFLVPRYTSRISERQCHRPVEQHSFLQMVFTCYATGYIVRHSDVVYLAVRIGGKWQVVGSQTRFDQFGRPLRGFQGKESWLAKVEI